MPKIRINFLKNIGETRLTCTQYTKYVYVFVLTIHVFYFFTFNPKKLLHLVYKIAVCFGITGFQGATKCPFFVALFRIIAKAVSVDISTLILFLQVQQSVLSLLHFCFELFLTLLHFCCNIVCNLFQHPNPLIPITFKSFLRL